MSNFFRNHLFHLFVLFSLCFAVAGVEAQVSIMPLGNSITRGVDGPSTDDAGYRNDLSTLLITEGQAFNFVGSLSDGIGFDSDHEGHDGFRAEQLLANIDTYLNDANPEVVILHIGTNDVSNDQSPESTRDEISDIIDAIDAFDSSIKVILCSIIPRTDAKDAETTLLNELIEDLFYNKRDEEGRNLYYAGINEIFKLNASWATDYFSVGDPVHPKDEGFNLMAEVIFNAAMTAINSTTTDVTDNFERTNLGLTWDADTEIVIQNGDLVNTAITGTSKWQYMATFKGVQNPSSVAATFAADADAAGIDEAGLALLLDAPSQNASGYLAWIDATNNELRLWTIVNGSTGTDLLATNPPSLASAPGPDKETRVDVSYDASDIQFDYYVDDEFAGSITIDNPGLGTELYSGVIFRHNRNNDIADFAVRKASDTTAPDAVDDLATGSPEATAMPLSWQATGDDGSTGIANSYDLRYSENPIDAGNFDQATQVQNVPGPSVPGTTENVTVTGLQPGTQYYFAVVVVDEAGNRSGLSNVVSASTEGGNIYVDNFNRASGLGSDWSANSAYDIVDNRLSNTETDGNWDDSAVLIARKNPKEMSFKFDEGANSAGLDQAGFVLAFTSASDTASGYAITRRTAVNEIRLWSLVDGAVGVVIDRNQSPALSPPQPGDVVKVVISGTAGSNQFDFYINDQFDGRVEDTGQLHDLDADNWGGITLRSNLNNDIDNFTMLLEIGAPASLAKISGDAQIDTVNQVLSNPIVVRVADENDSPIKGVNVDFEVVEGNGSVDVVSSTGEIVVEAESGSITAPMVIGQDGGASNGEFIHVPEGTGDNPKGLAEYFVTIPTTDDYIIWGRAIYPDANADAFRVIVAGTSYLWDIGQRDHQNDWHWDEVASRGSGTAKNPEIDPLVLNFTAGTHLIKVEHSKDGASLDQFVLTPAGSGFTPPANQGPIEPSGKFTDENGEALVNWTLGPAPGNNSLKISAAGLPDLFCSATGVADSVATISKISGDQQTGVPGQPLSAPFEVELLDKWGNLASNAPLNFTVLPPGDGSLTVTSRNAGSDGRATSLLTLATNTPFNQVLVSADGYTGPDVIFSATAEAGDPTSIALQDGDGQTASAGQNLANALQVIVRDDNDVPVPDVSVTFSVKQGDGNIEGNASKVVITNLSGIAEVTPTLGPVAGAVNIFEAAAGGLQGSPVSFTANAAAPARLDAISSLTNSGQTNLPLADSVEVEVLDELEAPVVGQQVGFAVTAGGGLVNGSASINVDTDAAGRARVEWRMGSGTGTHRLIVSANYQGASLENSPIEFTADVTGGPAENLSIVSGNDQTGLVSQPLQNPFVVKVENSGGNGVANWPVTFSVQAGGGSLSVDSTFTNGQGLAESRLTLGDQVGAENNEVQVSAPQTNDVTFQASAVSTTASTIELTAGGGQAPSPAGLPLPEKVKVLVTDDASIPIAGVGVTFRIQTGGGTIDGTAAADTSVVVVTGSNGEAEVEWFLGGVLGSDNQSLQISARNGVNHLSGSPLTVLATAIPGPVDQDVSMVESDKNTVKGDGQDVAMITVTLKDKFNNPVAGEEVNIFSDGNDIITQPENPTDENGQAVGSIASSDSGKRVVSAMVVAGVTLSATVEIEFEDVTAVELASFSAHFSGFDGVQVQWLTFREVNNAGFNILRSKSAQGTFIKVNTELIQPNKEGEYLFSDIGIDVGQNYYYLLEDVDINGLKTSHGPILVQVDVPETFELSQNYPNPFNPETNIRFQLPDAGRVHIRVFDTLGRRVRELMNGELAAGFHVVKWNAKNDAGIRVGSGIYYYQIVTGEQRMTKRMLLLK